MSMRRHIGVSLFSMLVAFGFCQAAMSHDFADEIESADKKFILEQYNEAIDIYQKIIRGSEPSVVEAYAHYKLGTLYKRQNEYSKAREEYEKGLVSLSEAGKKDHQMARLLTNALDVSN